ncbi:hypothetical protein [Microbulbifer sp. YPW1]|uniref:hypothetical protein n=1 Tax=Microbulbifer sp. YPW1 TaxID=2745199 RepID=UPI001597AE8C|nr:hypothetical protein [Microbulbifer sp. YPW1]QKX16908.1 hypothetical protein HUW35_07785 [Microbulbifer sp. YPW1]
MDKRAEFDEEAKYRLLWMLFRADSTKGLRLSKALEEIMSTTSLTSASNRRLLKDQAEAFLRQYNSEHGGVVCVNDWGKHDEEIEPIPRPPKSEKKKNEAGVKNKKNEKGPHRPGKVRCYKLTAEPEILHPRSLRLHLLLVGKFNEFFLPKNERKALVRLIKSTSSNQKIDSLIKRLRYSARYPGIFPNTDTQRLRLHEQVALRALEEEMGFPARYQGGREIIYFPVRLVRREQISYLVCTTDERKGIYEEMALHRFSIDIGITDSVDDFPLKERNHSIDYTNPTIKPRIPGNWGELEKLELEVEGPVAIHLSEMRFHPKEEKKHLTEHEFLQHEPVPRVLLRIHKLWYDYEFKTWLLGLGAALKAVRAVPAFGHEQVDPLADLTRDISAQYSSLVPPEH